MVEKKITFDNWQVALVKSCHYDIYKSENKKEYGIQVTLFFDELNVDDLDNNRALTIPFARGFPTPQEAFEWIEKCGEIFPHTLRDVWVLDEKGEILTKWELLEEDNDDEDDEDNLEE